MYIIDGHNLLWSVHKVQPDQGEIDEIKLCRMISEYLKLSGDSGQIVFDGIGPPEKETFNYIAALEVFFSGTNTDADTVIKRKIEADSAPKRLIVVSTDRQVRDAARSRKATSIKSEQFWAGLLTQLSKRRKFKEPNEKQQGLDDAQTKRWLDYFDIEQ